MRVTGVIIVGISCAVNSETKERYEEHSGKYPYWVRTIYCSTWGEAVIGVFPGWRLPLCRGPNGVTPQESAPGACL